MRIYGAIGEVRSLSASVAKTYGFQIKILSSPIKDAAMKRFALALIVIAAVAPVHAQVYKCRDASGVTVYSAQPCAADAQPINVRPASGASRQAAPPAASAQPSAEARLAALAPLALVQRGNDAAQRRILDDDITPKQREIAAMNA